MVGMLWYDDSKKSLEERITQGAEYFLKQYGERCMRAHVNPKQATVTTVGEMKVVPDRSILMNHIWFVRRGDEQ